MNPGARLFSFVKAALRNGIPAALIFFVVRPGAPGIQRIDVGAALAGYWTFFYVRRRQGGLMLSLGEWSEMGATDWPRFWRSFRPRVPSLMDGDEPWNPYREHRARRDLRVARVDDALHGHAPDARVIVDLGSAEPLAGRITGRRIVRVDLERSGHGTGVAAAGEAIPIRNGSADAVVMSDAIEHLLRPDAAVWEIARILREGGTLVLTTNNAAAMPARSPLAHPFLWLEKVIGFRHPGALSGRSWRWPVPIDGSLTPEGRVYLPHTHHIAAETRAMLAAAGLETIAITSFGFPPLGSPVGEWLARRPRAAAAVERICAATPLVRRLGDHLVLVAHKVRAPSGPSPRGVWPGPLSE